MYSDCSQFTTKDENEVKPNQSKSKSKSKPWRVKTEAYIYETKRTSVIPTSKGPTPILLSRYTIPALRSKTLKK